MAEAFMNLHGQDGIGSGLIIDAIRNVTSIVVIHDGQKLYCGSEKTCRDISRCKGGYEIKIFDETYHIYLKCGKQECEKIIRKIVNYVNAKYNKSITLEFVSEPTVDSGTRYRRLEQFSDETMRDRFNRFFGNNS